METSFNRCPEEFISIDEDQHDGKRITSSSSLTLLSPRLGRMMMTIDQKGNASRFVPLSAFWNTVGQIVVLINTNSNTSKPVHWTLRMTLSEKLQSLEA
eukprot:2920095-Rhodomonas_salina.2